MYKSFLKDLRFKRTVGNILPASPVFAGTKEGLDRARNPREERIERGERGGRRFRTRRTCKPSSEDPPRT